MASRWYSHRGGERLATPEEVLPEGGNESEGAVGVRNSGHGINAYCHHNFEALVDANDEDRDWYSGRSDDSLVVGRMWRDWQEFLREVVVDPNSAERTFGDWWESHGPSEGDGEPPELEQVGGTQDGGRARCASSGSTEVSAPASELQVPGGNEEWDDHIDEIRQSDGDPGEEDAYHRVC